MTDQSTSAQRLPEFCEPLWQMTEADRGLWGGLTYNWPIRSAGGLMLAAGLWGVRAGLRDWARKPAGVGTNPRQLVPELNRTVGHPPECLIIGWYEIQAAHLVSERT